MKQQVQSRLRALPKRPAGEITSGHNPDSKELATFDHTESLILKVNSWPCFCECDSTRGLSKKKAKGKIVDLQNGVGEERMSTIVVKSQYGRPESHSPPLVSPATSCELVRVDLTDLIEKGSPVLLTRTYGEYICTLKAPPDSGWRLQNIDL